MMTKLCKTCNEQRPVAEYRRYKSAGKDYIRLVCRSCERSIGRSWRQENPEYNAAWKARNPTYAANWRKQNAASNLRAKKDWNKRNPDKCRVYRRRAREKNPGRYRALTAKFQVLKRSPTCISVGFDLEATIPFYERAFELTKATGVEHHVDHIVPLCDGGLHEASNLQVISAHAHKNKTAKQRAVNAKSKSKDRVREWRSKNPDRAKAQDGKGKAIRRGGKECIPADFDFEATVSVYAHARVLTEQTGVEYHVDHIIPLRLGGKHEASNLQALTSEDHKSKSSRDACSSPLLNKT